jgi:hypothetical protein
MATDDTITLPELEPDWAFDLRMLDPAQVRLFRLGGLLRLTIADERSWIRVSPVRAQPISDPDHYIGLLDGAGKDIGMIREPALLDKESQALIAEDLELRYFVPVVEEVLAVKEEFGTIYWTLRTSRGHMDAIVRHLRDSLQELPGNRVMITDVDGNRFEFPDTTQLDSISLGLILRHL